MDLTSSSPSCMISRIWMTRSKTTWQTHCPMRTRWFQKSKRVTRKNTAMDLLKKLLTSISNLLSSVKKSLTMWSRDLIRATWKHLSKSMTKHCQWLTSRCSRRHLISMLKHARRSHSASMKVESLWFKIIQSSWPNSNKHFENLSHNNKRSFTECLNLILTQKTSKKPQRVIMLVKTRRWKLTIKNTRYGFLNASMSQSIPYWTLMRSLMMSPLRLQTSVEKIGLTSMQKSAKFVSLFSIPPARGKTWTRAIVVPGQSWSTSYQKVTGLSSSSTPISTVKLIVPRPKPSAMQWMNTSL